jgi:hypothetical protein
MLRKHIGQEHGYALVDAVTGFVLFALSVVSIYQVFIPTFALWRNSDERIVRQQDVRLVIDRLARDLHETTASSDRLQVYTAAEGCTGAYEGCIGFVTARDNTCAGVFQLAPSGDPNWQATIYVWRDTASNELRRRCQEGTILPVGTWPPTLTPYTVIGRRVIQASFALESGGIAISVREQASTASRPTYRYQTSFFTRTIFVPQN